MSHQFKILSLDGGGIKGLYTATVLSHFEEEFKVPVGQVFDMICGTSTGGLIALALSKGIPAKDLVTFYKNEGPNIFYSKRFLSRIRGLYRQIAGNGKYDNANLRNALEGILGKTMMSEAQNLLCIPSFNLTSGTPRVFKFPHKEGGYSEDYYGSMMDAALATSAAPTYFPAFFSDNTYYADGGVWANNPTLCGIRDALEYFVGEDKPLKGRNNSIRFSSYSILSIACLPQKNGWAHTGNSSDLKMSFLNWQDKLFETSLDGQSQFAHQFAERIVYQTKAQGTYYRIEGPSEISAPQQALLTLDNTSSASLQALEQLGNRVGKNFRTRLKGDISHFFLHKKLYQTN